MTRDMLSTTEFKNGTKSYSVFSDQEFKSRQGKIRHWLQSNKIDAALFSSIQGITYYSGWTYCSFGRKYGLVIIDDKVTTVSAGIDGGHAWRRAYADNVVYTDWRRDNYFRALRTLMPNIRRLAIEFDHVTVEFKAQLETAFPDVVLYDISQASMWMRTIKSDEEQQLIREGARIADIAGADVVAAVKAGAAEHEIAMASTNRIIREIAASFPFVELMDSWSWVQSGINTDGAHNPVTNRCVQPGDIISLNCFPMIFGYYTALERTLFCEYADDASLDIWQKNIAVHRRGLELLQPGATCKDIARELNEMYRQWDLLRYRSFGYGHSFGVLSHYYGREAAVELREDVETELQPGMVVSMEPMLTIPQGVAGAGGYREHDILIITKDGAENITKFPIGPEHNIVKPA